MNRLFLRPVIFRVPAFVPANRRVVLSKRTMSSSSKPVPTLYEWAGGRDKIEALFRRFYEKVPKDATLQPVFAKMPSHHAKVVSNFVSEVLGGPNLYSGEAGHGHHSMIAKHVNRMLTDVQRKRWMGLLLETADELKLPDDPEFRSALVAYLEWGSRIAVITSKSAADAPVDKSVPMPKWGWGVPGGPYIPAEATEKKS